MTKPMTPLRRRMIDDMAIRNMSPSTQKIYVRAVASFSIFHGRSPGKLTSEDVRVYRLHLISRGFKATSINPIIGALRFFYRTTLGKKQLSEEIPYARIDGTLPAVLARDEVVRFLRAVTDLKIRTAFIAGLRVSEAVKLTAHDIDSARMVLTIRQAKGRKDRYVMLSEQFLAILRDYWNRAHLIHLLFPGPDEGHLSLGQRRVMTAIEICRTAALGGHIGTSAWLKVPEVQCQRVIVR